MGEWVLLKAGAVRAILQSIGKIAANQTAPPAHGWGGLINGVMAFGYGMLS